jgi:hypothetical protein
MSRRKAKADVCPPKSFTDKLIRLEEQTGLDQSEIIRALVMGASAQLVRVCAAEIGLKVSTEPALVVPGSAEHLPDAEHYLRGGVVAA